MAVEPWTAYIPEINAGRFETGTGPESWMTSATMWLGFGAMVVEAMGIFTSQLAVMGVNWQGAAPTAMGAAAMEFMEWLGEMEVAAIANAAACEAVATAYAAGQGSMIPLAAVNANRASELIAEMTNFLGINSGLILFLNGQYGDFWAQNGATMMTYDEAVTTATIPKPVRPPPPLASLAAAGAQLADAAAQAAAKAGVGAASQSAMQGLSQSVAESGQGAATGAEGPGQSMSSLLGSAGQLFSAPGQLLGQGASAAGQLGSPAQQLMSPFTSLISNMGGNLNASDAAAFGIGGPSTAAFGGTAVSGGSDAAGVGPVGFGGGLGGAMMASGAYMGSSGPPPRSQPVFSGVSTKQSELAVAPAGAGSGGGLYGGGGMAPAAHAAGESSGTRKSSGIMAVQTKASLSGPSESEADELFGDR
ncbi:MULTISPECIES: PPE domain-containing protein [Mycobacterium]|uniref:PPE domain-containing protein n=1 Tax=Mycobacterium kyorinense TaxID=487514 RepID=A0A1X1XX67_9MYCO|nr:MULTISPECIES: PPE domain-containing protein [Mycobacterium]ORW03361.1 hypothetical protein AWC14_05295 [Mycobacterium kyorinense]PBJ66052.1 hypothetical protein BB737_09595 [Mycobacterium avium subsp. hominissuis]